MSYDYISVTSLLVVIFVLGLHGFCKKNLSNILELNFLEGRSSNSCLVLVLYQIKALGSKVTSFVYCSYQLNKVKGRVKNE